METYAAFLWGINVGGRNKIAMAELRIALENDSYSNVRTYIQSGNVVFESDFDKTDDIAISIQKIIQDVFTLDIPVVVKTKERLGLILSESPYSDEEYVASNKTYVVLLFQTPNGDLLTSFKSLRFPNEEFQVAERCIHVLCKHGYGKAKLNNNFIASKLKVTATARNYRTMQKVLALMA